MEESKTNKEPETNKELETNKYNSKNNLYVSYTVLGGNYPKCFQLTHKHVGSLQENLYSFHFHRQVN